MTAMTSTKHQAPSTREAPSSKFQVAVVVVALLLGIGGSPVQGAELKFSWRANGETDLAGYKLYQGGPPEGGTPNPVWTNAIVVLAPATNYCLAVGGRQYFALSAFSIHGLESDLTAAVEWIPPATLRVVSERSVDGVWWTAALTNEVGAEWPMEFWRVRLERGGGQ